MRPYPRKQLRSSFAKQVYNYRHSRHRKIVENCFGVLTKRFRLYQRKLQITPEHIDIVVGATCCLYNFLRTDICYWTSQEQGTNTPNMQTLRGIDRVAGNLTTRVMAIRDMFQEYFISENGAVHWQIDIVRRGCHE